MTEEKLNSILEFSGDSTFGLSAERVTVMQQLETDMPPYEVAEKVSSILTSKGLVVKGDTIVITRGSTMGKSGNSDTMQIRKIGG